MTCYGGNVQQRLENLVDLLHRRLEIHLPYPGKGGLFESCKVYLLGLHGATSMAECVWFYIRLSCRCQARVGCLTTNSVQTSSLVL